MPQLELRTVPDAESKFRWLIADHIWDGISAPIAVSPEAFDTEEEAKTAGTAALFGLQTMPARDHPFGG